MCENTLKKYTQETSLEKLKEYWPEYTNEMKHEYARHNIDLEEMIKLFLREHPAYYFRSVNSLAIDCGVFMAEIEKSLKSLLQKGTVVQHLRDEEQFGLFERVKDCAPGMFNYPPITRDNWNEHLSSICNNYFQHKLNLEQTIERILADHPIYHYRSISALAKELNSSREVIEQAINSLCKRGVVVQNALNEDQYGVLERLKKDNATKYISPETWQKENNPIINPATFEPFTEPFTQQKKESHKEFSSDSFVVMQDCLREVQKIITRAENLNQQVPEIIS